MSEEKKTFVVAADIEKASGYQTWKMKANTSAEAVELVGKGKGDFYHEEVEVTALGKFFYTGECIEEVYVLPEDTSSDKDKLWALCKEFVVGNEICCPEDVHRCDQVLAESAQFIKKICRLVGWEDEEE